MSLFLHIICRVVGILYKSRGKCVGDDIISLWVPSGWAEHKKISAKETWFFILQEQINI